MNLLGDKIERKDLITINTNLARMYGLLKVHKDNCPLRPVVSYINSPFYFMAKFFNNILKSVPKPFSNIKNSFEFINKIKNLKIPNNYTMISLDAISLFYQNSFRLGSPISPSLADLVMQDLETDIFKRIEFDIPVYFRYVDDTF